ncbi:MAG: NAD-dependent epimerase/dehydratase family protein [Flavobacteriales bacterium]|nr:NAD-dependent epimerase/dehydratase family protein [Flavobacteriales bacterium]
MSKILITGGAGFIASALAAKLAEEPKDHIVIVDNLETGELKKVPVSRHNNITFIKCDANDFKDISSVFFAWKFDFVFHYAALVGVKRTLEHPVKVLNDVEGIKNILNLSKNTGVRRVLFSSSSEVYGEPVEFPQNEDTTPLNSRLPYAIVKNLAEAFLRSYQKEYGLDFSVFRFFNTYGPLQSEDFVISRFIRAALEGRILTVYGEGKQTRTFCFIDDNVDACVNAFRKSLFVNDVVNIGSEVEVPILELAQMVIGITGSASKIVHAPALEEGDMTRRKPDNTKMRELLGRDLVSLDEGLKRIITNWTHK